MSVNIYDATNDELTPFAGGTLYADSPIGTIFSYGGASTNLPSGFLLCDGSEVLKTEYADLYAVIGDSFGTASENTKFVLPDLREATVKGAGLTGKSNNHMDADGLALGEFTDDRIQNHKHKVYTYATQSSGNAYVQGNAGTGTDAFSEWPDASSLEDCRHGDTTEVKAVGVNFIIKALKVAIPADFDVTGIPDDVWAMIEALI